MKFKTASAVLVFLAAESTAASNLREGRELGRKDDVKGNGKGKGKGKDNGKGAGNGGKDSMPNIVVIMIDDLGWNQVGYHANPVENFEIYTPSIDTHADEGIKIDRGYATPCKYIDLPLPLFYSICSTVSSPCLYILIPLFILYALSLTRQGAGHLGLLFKQVPWPLTTKHPPKVHGPTALKPGLWEVSHRS